MANLDKVVYLSEAQKETLFTNGSITVNGQTIEYSDDDLYVTPSAIDTAPAQGSSNLITSGAVYNAIEDVTYENKTAVDNGTDVSLVSTGDKYNWNNKYTKPSAGIPDTDLSTEVRASLGKADTAFQSVPNAGSISNAGIISIKHDNTELFSIQLPLYTGGATNGT